MDFRLFFFADNGAAAADGYRLLLESARFADTHGLTAVWTPERHFHSFGGLYPNPAVNAPALGAARFPHPHGLTAVWTPERHFHSFGGLYPNPAVTGAAVAAVTERVGIR